MVVALTDVYTGTVAQFQDAADAKKKMRQWVGKNPKFHAHAAQFEFEAWLLPYWDKIQALAKRKKKPPRGDPEMVDHQRPPSVHIKELFQAGGGPRHYSKVRDAKAILRGSDLNLAIAQCREFKSFVNTILRVSGGKEID